MVMLSLANMTNPDCHHYYQRRNHLIIPHFIQFNVRYCNIMNRLTGGLYHILTDPFISLLHPLVLVGNVINAHSRFISRYLEWRWTQHRFTVTSHSTDTDWADRSSILLDIPQASPLAVYFDGYSDRYRSHPDPFIGSRSSVADRETRIRPTSTSPERPELPSSSFSLSFQVFHPPHLNRNKQDLN
jgi:hypothetical protein